MLPCMSMASVRPSGETATDIDVPSWTVTSIRAGVDAGAAASGPSPATALPDPGPHCGRIHDLLRRASEIASFVET
jgi:hypothetical protein